MSKTEIFLYLQLRYGEYQPAWHLSGPDYKGAMQFRIRAFPDWYVLYALKSNRLANPYLHEIVSRNHSDGVGVNWSDIEVRRMLTNDLIWSEWSRFADEYAGWRRGHGRINHEPRELNQSV